MIVVVSETTGRRTAMTLCPKDYFQIVPADVAADTWMLRMARDGKAINLYERPQRRAWAVSDFSNLVSRMNDTLAVMTLYAEDEQKATA